MNKEAYSNGMPLPSLSNSYRRRAPFGRIGVYIRTLWAGLLCAGMANAATVSQGGGQADAEHVVWTFAVSGDSRNCGNVVMPAIAASVKKEGAAFYWHLGDFRAIYKFDEDYVAERNIKRDGNEPTVSGYLSSAWDDFIDHQVKPFGATPVYLAPGNHETIPPKTHDDVLRKFSAHFDSPELKQQRLSDNPLALNPVAYYHWVKDGIDFISLDNSVNYSVDEAQLNWLLSIVRRDELDDSIATIVVGMHEALPDSLSASHSMCSSDDGRRSGRTIYRALVHATQAQSHKNVYVLASHSHFYLENIYNTNYWKAPANGGVVLPGWVVGTAGAVRYKLPPDLPAGTKSLEHVYGYLLGSVASDHSITFAFQELKESDLQAADSGNYTPDFVHWCATQNPLPSEMQWDNGDDPCKEK